MESSPLIQIEIILLILFFAYFVYYIGYSMRKGSRRLRNVLGISGAKRKKGEQQQFKVNVEKSDDSSVKEHGKNKKRLTSSDKIRLAELLKKVKIHISKKDFDIAKNLIIEGLTIDKFHTGLNLELANIYIEDDDYVKAEYIYKDLILVHSENAAILKKLGYVLSIQEKYALGIEIYKKTYKLDKGDTDVLNMLGQLTFYVGDYLGAIKYTKKFLKIKPKDVENLQILASAYEKTQSRELALAAYKEISEVKPYEPTILSHIERLEGELDLESV